MNSCFGRQPDIHDVVSVGRNRLWLRLKWLVNPTKSATSSTGPGES